MSKTGAPRRVSFGAIQAATAEKRGDPIILDFAGTEVKVEPLGAWKAGWSADLTTGDILGFLRRGLGDDGYDALMACDPSNDDLNELIRELQGVTPGESSGSSS